MYILDNKYKIVSNKDNVIVSVRADPSKARTKRRDANDTSIRYNSHSYFSNLFSALRYILNQEINNACNEEDNMLSGSIDSQSIHIDSMIEMMEKLSQIEIKFDKAIKELKDETTKQIT